MSTTLIGCVMFIGGMFLIGVANGAFGKLAERLVKAGSGMRGGRQDKFSAALAITLTVLAQFAVACGLYAVPMWLAYTSVELMGLVNWEVFFRNLPDTFAGMIMFLMIYNTIGDNVKLYDMFKKVYGKKQDKQ